MRQLKILLRMLRNRFLSSDPELRSEHTSFLDRIVFVLNFFPPYNYACCLWVMACARWMPRSGVALAISRSLMRRGLLYGALRHLGPEDRNAFAKVALLPGLKAARPVPPVQPEARALAAELARTGFVSLGSVITRDKAAAAVSYFRGQRGYASQTPMQSDGVLRPFDVDAPGQGLSERYFCFSCNTSLGCPQIAEVIDNPLIRQVAAAYLGFTPVLFGVNTIATVKGTGDHYVMRMHRDYDAFAAVTFFIYWTDVAADNGATLYLPGTHVSSAAASAERAYLTGGAGQIFGLDTFGLHAGNRSVEGFRLATWFRFGSGPNLATIQDPNLVPEYRQASLAVI